MFRPGNIGHLGRLGLVAASSPSLTTQALAILVKYGTAANLYVPGVGVINGINTNNWADTVGGTLVALNGTVGAVSNVTGTANLTQTTSANRPTLRLVNNKHMWQLDGTNDSFSIGALPFGMSDDSFVVMSAQISSLAANSDLFAMRSTSSSNPIFVLRASTTGAIQAIYRDNAQPTPEIVSTTSNITQNVSFVASMRKVSNTKIVRLNGGSQAQGTTVFGATTFTGASIGVSPTSTPAQYTNGYIGVSIQIRGIVTDSDMQLLEKWVGFMSGVVV